MSHKVSTEKLPLVSDVGHVKTPVEADKEAVALKLKAPNVVPADANNLYEYLVYKPVSIVPRVWSGRKTNFSCPGDESMYSAINRLLEAVVWVQLISWKNDTAATQSYQYSYTTGLTITQGSEVNEGFDLGASYQGMSIGYNYSQRTFKSTETTTSQTTTITVNVPPHSLLVFYQRRYDFRDEITFICDAWGREWNIGPWGGYDPLVKKIVNVQIMAEEYLTSSIQLPNGPAYIASDYVSAATITDTARKRENVTQRSKNVLDKMGL